MSDRQPVLREMTPQTSSRDILAECGCLYQVTGTSPLTLMSKLRCQTAQRLLLPEQHLDHLGLERRSGANRRQRNVLATSCTRRHAPSLPAWTPFERGTINLDPKKRQALFENALALARQTDPEVTREAVEAVLNAREWQELWVNSRYTVLVNREAQVGPGWPPMTWLSIRRNDRECPGEERWRDFQRIKNELVGQPNEGVELYPAEDRVADCANQFHLLVINDPSFQFPFGFAGGLRSGTSVGGSVQRPFEDEDAGSCRTRQRPT